MSRINVETTRAKGSSWLAQLCSATRLIYAGVLFIWIGIKTTLILLGPGSGCFVASIFNHGGGQTLDVSVWNVITQNRRQKT